MAKDSESLELIKGFLRFWSETGTEGGHWAFQDRNFIKENTTQFSCKKCYKYWDKEKYPDAPPPPHTKPVQVELAIPLNKVDLNSVKNNTFEFPPPCKPDEHDFQLMGKTLESYDGLHVLKDNDWLTIYGKDSPTTIAWSGIIKLTNYPPFTEHVSGLWIHSDQEGVDRETWSKWFLEGYPATLVPYKKIKFNT